MSAKRINEKIGLKVSSEVINTCYDLLSSDVVEDFVEYLLRNKMVERSDVLKINGEKPDTNEKMRTLLSVVEEKQIPIGGCLLHFLKSKIRMMSKMVEQVEKTHKVITEHVLVEEVGNLLQTWKLENCIPCKSERAHFTSNISHTLSIIVKQGESDVIELTRDSLTDLPEFRLNRQELWENLRYAYGSEDILMKKLVISDVKVDVVDLYRFLSRCSNLEELVMTNVHIVRSIAISFTWFDSEEICKIKIIKVKYCCKDDKDIMNAGLSLEYLKEWFNGEAMLFESEDVTFGFQN